MCGVAMGDEAGGRKLLHEAKLAEQTGRFDEMTQVKH